MPAARSESRVWRSVASRRCASACAACVLCAVLVACGGSRRDPDGGPDPDATIAGGGTLVVSLAGDVESLEDDVVLDALTLRAASLRARGDRGGDFDPRIDAPMNFDLTAGPATRSFDAAPATYSALALRLESAGGEPAFHMRVSEAGQPSIELVDEGPIDLDLRCSSPGVLEPSGTLALVAALELGELHGELRSLSLPAPVDGVIRVDSTSAPDVVAALRVRIARHWETRCGSEVDE